MILEESREHAMLNAHISHQPVSMMTAVNFGELKISQNPAETLVAFSIGSGICVSIYDPVTKSGGLLNFMLPDSSMLLPAKAQIQPFMFADTGLAALFDALHDLGAQMKDVKVVLAGGAQIIDQTTEFNIGHKNHQAVTSLLNAEHLTVRYSDIGGIFLRTLRLDMRNGDTVIRTMGQTEVTV
ncbi:MAG: chemotaxis protein CheD [Desulfobacterales bacterium]|jgi:chemotaxis protein CheD